MASIKDRPGSTDEALLAELGHRIARHRLAREWSQAELAREAGVGKRTLERIEAGGPAQLVSLVRILRALDLLPVLEQLLPDPGPRPMELLKLRGKQRQRAPGRRRKVSPAGAVWSWDEEP